jgi:L-methionine (R)-S-oxide reductase
MMTVQELIDCIEGDTFTEQCQSICACLREADSRYEWVGIYWLKGETLNLGAWSGPEDTPHKKIPLGEGICGAAARENKTVIVDDVTGDSRYLACFPSTRSEIVVPIHAKGKVIGEIDIDGTKVAAFSAEDGKFLEGVADYIGTQWSGKGK